MEDDEAAERQILQLKVCSARKLATPSNAFVQVELGGWSRQTTVKKHTDRPIWNETFVFPVDSSVTDYTMYLKNRDALGKVSVIGKTQVGIPAKANELMDIWLTLDGLVTDIHLCMQLEPLAGRSLDSLLQNNRPGSARSSLIRFGSSSFRLLSSLTSTSADGSSASSGSSATPGVSSDGSSFAVRAGAVTLTEICQALDRLRGVIYLAGSEGAKLGEERQVALQTAKVELDELADQIEEVEGLSEEWKDKLGSLVEDYAQDCWKMLSDESWANLAVKRQSRVPPPLPSRETLNKIRQERMSSALEMSPVPPNVPPPRAPPASGAASKSPPASPTASRPRPTPPSGEALIGTVKEHFVDSLEAFDEMMDLGFVVEFPQGRCSKKCGARGDLVRCRFTAYVYDGAVSKAVVYDSSGDEYIEFILGESHEDIPRGLMAALQKIPHTQSLALVTVTPDWGFGDDGHSKGVPPNSSLVFEVRDAQFAARPVGTSSPKLGDTQAEAVPQNSPPPPDTSLFRLYGTFPARDPEVVLDKKAPTPPPVVHTSELASPTPAVPKRRSLLRSFSSSSKDSPKEPADANAKKAVSPNLSRGSNSAPSSPGSPVNPMMAELSVRLSRRVSQSEAQQ